MRADLRPLALVDEGLGNSSYLVDLGDGRALAVDPARDPGPYLAAAGRRGLTIAYAAETHLHADFVSGSRELAAAGRPGARLGGRRTWSSPTAGWRRRRGGPGRADAAGAGDTRAHPRAPVLPAPGRQPAGRAVLRRVAAGRRGGPHRPDRARSSTEALARALCRSLHERILTLPDELAGVPDARGGVVLLRPARRRRAPPPSAGRRRPTRCWPHRARTRSSSAARRPGHATRRTSCGCARSTAAVPPSAAPSRRALAALTAGEVRALLRRGGASLVDVRPIADFAAGHIPGALSIPLRDGVRHLARLARRPRRAVGHRPRPRARTAATSSGRRCKIGYEQPRRRAGRRHGRLDRPPGSPSAGPPVLAAEVDRPGPRRPAGRRVRRRAPARRTPHRARRPARPTASPVGAGPVTLMCGHGERAMTAASLLDRAGHRDVTVAVGGPDDWAAGHRPHAAEPGR